jgi:hypothetical protein
MIAVSISISLIEDNYFLYCWFEEWGSDDPLSHLFGLSIMDQYSFPIGTF